MTAGDRPLQPGDDVLIVAKVVRTEDDDRIVVETGGGTIVRAEREQLRTTGDLERIAGDLVDRALRERARALGAILAADRPAPRRRWFGW